MDRPNHQSIASFLSRTGKTRANCRLSHSPAGEATIEKQAGILKMKGLKRIRCNILPGLVRRRGWGGLGEAFGKGYIGDRPTKVLARRGIDVSVPPVYLPF